MFHLDATHVQLLTAVLGTAKEAIGLIAASLVVWRAVKELKQVAKPPSQQALLKKIA
jgi:hypothetical protein